VSEALNAVEPQRSQTVGLIAATPADSGTTPELTQGQIVDLLQQIDLFASFAPGTLHRVAQACKTLTLDAQQVLFKHGSFGSSLFIVVDGALEVFREDRAIAVVQRNQYIGELALFDPGVRSASVRAVGPTRLLEVSHDVFNLYLRSDPEALTAMMRTISSRMRGTLDDTQASYEQVNMLVHDMLNLLSVLTAAALVADDLPPEDENRRFLDLISHAQDRLETMMRDALRKARGATAYRKAPQDIVALVRQCLDRDLVLHPDMKRVNTRLEVGQISRPCLCNPGDLQRVVANLLINAAQALPDGGNVVIRVAQDEAATQIGVSDNGPGIRPEVLPFIFDTHFTTKPTGNGLGLSSCKLIVESLHGGSLCCDSKLGGGTTFSVVLPG